MSALVDIVDVSLDRVSWAESTASYVEGAPVTTCLDEHNTGIRYLADYISQRPSSRLKLCNINVYYAQKCLLIYFAVCTIILPRLKVR